MGVQAMRDVLWLALTASAMDVSTSVAKGIVGGLTNALVLIRGPSTTNTAPRRRAVAEITPQMLLDGLRQDIVEREYLWTGKISEELYDEDCSFRDPTIAFQGLATFERNVAAVDSLLRFVKSRRVCLRDLRLDDDGAVAQWRMVGAFPWGASLRLEGTTRYLTGDDGRILKYEEDWDNMSALGALTTIFKPDVKPPTDLRGKRFLVLPGFANSKSDYETPFGDPNGFAGALRRRGAIVDVLDVARLAWLRVFLQADWSYIVGSADWTTSAYAWYIGKCRRYLEESRERVFVVGHSAGGWLARALLRKYPELEAKIEAVATLGTPHRPPARGCVTRGVLRALARADALDPPLVNFVTVAGDLAPATADIVQESYSLVSGRDLADVKGLSGDGVVPETFAHLDFATERPTIAAVHSINVVGTLQPTPDPWYGSEARLDDWLPALLRASSLSS